MPPLATGPSTPASAPSGGRPGLDAPPPLPPSLKTPDYTGLANQVTPSAPLSGQLAQMAIARGALVIKLLTSLGEMLPSFAPAAAQGAQQLQAALLKSIQQDSQGGGPGSGGGGQPGAVPPPPGAPAPAGAPPPGPGGPPGGP